MLWKVKVHIFKNVRPIHKTKTRSNLRLVSLIWYLWEHSNWRLCMNGINIINSVLTNHLVHYWFMDTYFYLSMNLLYVSSQQQVLIAWNFAGSFRLVIVVLLELFHILGILSLFLTVKECKYEADKSVF